MLRKISLLVTAMLLGALVIAATVIAQQSAVQGNDLRAPVTGGVVTPTPVPTAKPAPTATPAPPTPVPTPPPAIPPTATPAPAATARPTPRPPTPTPMSTPTPACTLDIELDYAEGTLDLGFLIGAKEPALWNVWLIFRGQFIPLWGAPIIVLIDPPTHVPTFSVPVPPSGLLMFFTTLTTSEGMACWDFDLIDTSAPSSQALSANELRDLFSNANAAIPEDTR